MRPSTSPLAALVIGLASLSVACGGSSQAAPADASAVDAAGEPTSDTGDAVDTSIDATDGSLEVDAQPEVGADSTTCAAFAQAACDATARCNTWSFTVGYGADLTLCRARMALACQHAAEAPDTGATTNAVKACAPSFAGSCDQVTGVRVPACDFRGGRAEGQTCGDGAQCQSGFCAIKDGDSCGVCAAASTPGGACAQQQCSAGLLCSGGRCYSLGKLGATCDSNFLACRMDATCVGGTCVPAPTLGDGCGTSAATACSIASATYCDPATSKCVAPTIVAPGGECAYFPFTKLCGGASWCFGGSGTGTCIAYAKDGEPCALTSGDYPPACTGPSRCITGACAFPAASTCG